MKKLSISILLMLMFSFISFAQNEKDMSANDKYSSLMEEEKLAHDVYQSFHDLYGKNVFQNILEAETRHFDMMAEVVRRKTGSDKEFNFGTLGKFEDPIFQKMYDELYEKGKESLTSALEVGAFIEETDIDDLLKVMELEKDGYTLDVMSRLVSASENHLRAFVKNLSKSDIEYTPEILSKEKYDLILAGESSWNSAKDKKGKACCSGDKNKNKKVKACCSGEKNKSKGKSKAKCCKDS